MEGADEKALVADAQACAAFFIAAPDPQLSSILRSSEESELDLALLVQMRYLRIHT
jgi:hypothetical protein